MKNNVHSNIDNFQYLPKEGKIEGGGPLYKTNYDASIWAWPRNASAVGELL